jgi:hypothetical protein
MSALIQINAAAYPRAKRHLPRRDPVITLSRYEGGTEVRDFPIVSNRADHSLMMREGVLEWYAFLFCQGGFRQLGMTFEQFLLVAEAIRPADLPANREDARTLWTGIIGSRGTGRWEAAR